MYLAEGSHQGVGLPRAGLPEGKDGAGEAVVDAERQARPQAVAQRCHLPTQPRQCKRAGKARRGVAGGLGSAGGSAGLTRPWPAPPAASPAAFEHSLLRGAGVEHGAEAKGGIVPGRAYLAVGTAVAQGVPQPSPSPTPPRGGGTYLDGAVTEAMHNLLVTSARLRAGQWPDPKGGVWTGTQRCRYTGTQGSPAVTSPQVGRFLPRS